MAKIYRAIHKKISCIKIDQFKKMSAWSLTHQESIFKRYMVTNIYQSFIDKRTAKINWQIYGKKLRNRHPVWLGSRAVSVLDSGAEGPGFKSHLRRCRVARVTAGLAESNGSLPWGL